MLDECPRLNKEIDCQSLIWNPVCYRLSGSPVRRACLYWMARWYAGPMISFSCSDLYLLSEWRFQLVSIMVMLMVTGSTWWGLVFCFSNHFRSCRRKSAGLLVCNWAPKSGWSNACFRYRKSHARKCETILHASLQPVLHALGIWYFLLVCYMLHLQNSNASWGLQTKNVGRGCLRGLPHCIVSRDSSFSDAKPLSSKISW